MNILLGLAPRGTGLAESLTNVQTPLTPSKRRCFAPSFVMSSPSPSTTTRTTIASMSSHMLDAISNPAQSWGSSVPHSSSTECQTAIPAHSGSNNVALPPRESSPVSSSTTKTLSNKDSTSKCNKGKSSEPLPEEELEYVDLTESGLVNAQLCEDSSNSNNRQDFDQPVAARTRNHQGKHSCK